ncbi:hypothetical protein [Roseateles toxinivorans]|uniref:Uncharacterized protein n=1 Tax=Roseateles toxinivorans TaxID=270368 RepID=A0A4R6QSA2_9BURK|nr:hypothetical protein [Roseateles toxinivorans]TDP74510.1 hypothetical protein DES47_101571 [Roseateles toxinivorans]
MSDRNITELEWRKFSKGRGYKDGVFVKALAALEAGKTPEAKLAALEDIEKQADLLRKANKADKALGSYLDDAEKAAGKERKQLEAEAKRTASQSSSGEEEEDSPALLTSKLVPLLRELKKGEATMHAMICTAGKGTAVLVMRRAIAPARREMLAEAIDAKGGAKYVAGECRYENQALTFIVQGAAAGMAKRLRQALYDQTDLRLKVVVRGEDGEDNDGDDDDDGDAPHFESSESEEQESSEKAQYLAQLRELAPKIDGALRGQTGDVGKLKAVFGFAQGKAKDGLYAAALQGLDAVAKLLAGEGTAPLVPPLTPTTTVKPETSSPPSRESREFTERVNEMLPRIKDGLALGLAGANGAKLKLSEAAAFTRKQEWQAAHDLLDQLDKDLALDRMVMPPTLSPEEVKRKEFARKQELTERWRQTVPEERHLVSMEGQMVGRADTPLAKLLERTFAQLRKANQDRDFEAALRIFGSIQALGGSVEAVRAEARRMMDMESPSYKEGAEEFLRDQGPEWIEQLRRQAAEDGYGLTSDGMVRYALPVSGDEWKRGALAPLNTIGRLVNEAEVLSRENGEDPFAVLPLIHEILSEQYSLIQLVERVRQYALDGSFTDRGHEEAAITIYELRNEFSEAIQPFLLMQAGDVDVEQLLRSIDELAATLMDYAPSEDGDGTTPLEQLQQAIKDIGSRKFGAAGTLLKSLRLEIERSRPEGEPGENLNDQIASGGDIRVRNLVAEKLFRAAGDLDILAAREGLPFDGVLSAFQKLDQAAKDFEKIL